MPNITGGIKNQGLFNLASGYGAIKTSSGGPFGGVVVFIIPLYLA